jgi:hypothetical protein
MIRYPVAGAVALVLCAASADAATFSLTGRAAGGSLFSVDAFTPDPAIFFLIDPASDPAVTISLLRDEDDGTGFFNQNTFGAAAGSAFDLNASVLTALLRVTFDRDDVLASFVTVTVTFFEEVTDIFAIADQDVLITVADAAPPPQAVPVPPALAFAATGVLALAGFRRRR